MGFIASTEATPDSRYLYPTARALLVYFVTVFAASMDDLSDARMTAAD
jgi:hypothetical protein